MTRGPKPFQITKVLLLERSIPEPNSGCWLWLGVTDGCGYGAPHIGQRMYLAHRLSYELFVGPIPADLTIDHKCCVRCCINPDHLEPVTRAENSRRAMARLRGADTACRNGHEFTPQNTYRDNRGWRVCRQCNRDAHARHRARKIAA